MDHPLSPPIPSIHVDDTVLSMENLSALTQDQIFRKISQESQNSQDSCHDENGAIAKGELDVRVKKSELKRSHSSVEAGMPEYKMMAYPRGLALIIGKKHALKKYDQFALNTSCFWRSTGSNITTVVQFHKIFVTKIMN